MRYGYNIQTWGSLAAHPLGVSSVKDCVYCSRVPTLEAVVQEIAQAGYVGFEIFDGDLLLYEGKPQEFRDLMSKTGMVLSGVYTGGNFIFEEVLPEELSKIKRVAELASQIEAEFLIVGGGAVRAGGIVDEDYRRLGKALDEVQKIASDCGLNVSYHPHLGTCCENWNQLVRVMENTTIGLCPDTAHIVAGGTDLVTLVSLFGDRINYVHLKDYKDGKFLELGEGMVDFKAFAKALQERGYDGWIVVELDFATRTPSESLVMNTRYLKAVLEEIF